MKIPLTKPYIGTEELAEILKPLESGWLVEGPQVRRFEEAVESYTGTPHAVAVSSCTAALHVAVAALGLKPGDEVIVPGFTWVATANAVQCMGARPVFCDIDLKTFNIDPKHIENLITPRTVGIIAVHQFGLCADMDPILAIARMHDLWLVEDAACALGSFYKGTYAGNLGDCGCFSFHPRKIITTGEGGMLVTQSEDIARKAVMLRSHGAALSSHDRFHSPEKYRMADHPMHGYNYRLTDLQGSLGIAQMRKLTEILTRREELASTYNTLLARCSWLRTPFVPDYATHNYQSYVCLFAPEIPTMENVSMLRAQRDAIMKSLEEEGIATSQGTHAPFLLSSYAKMYGYTPTLCENSYLAQELSIALPLYVQMTAEDQLRVTEALIGAYQKCVPETVCS